MMNAVKKWSLIDYIYLWVGVCFCVPTFMLVNTLWLNGFNLFESLIIVFIGNLLMGVIASIIGYIGFSNKQGLIDIIHVHFRPMVARVIIFFRGLISTGWFCINIYIVSKYILDFAIKYNVITQRYAIVSYVFIVFIMTFLNIILTTKMSTIRIIEKISTISFVVFFVILTALFVTNYDLTLDKINSSNISTMSSFFSIFNCISLFFMYWSGFVTNICDYSSYGKSSVDVVWGNFLGIQIGMLSSTLLAIIYGVTVYLKLGEYIWNPLDALVIMFNNSIIDFLALILMVIFMISTNTVSNTLPAIKCLAFVRKNNEAIPKFGLITLSLVFSILFLFINIENYVYRWIDLYGGFLTPLSGIVISNFLIKKIWNNQDLSLQNSYVYCIICFLMTALNIVINNNCIISTIGLLLSIALTLGINQFNKKKHIK